jgi:hypothetical protein
MSETGWTTCKAGFRHPPGSICDHMIAQVGPLAAPKRQRYRLPPNHRTVVVNEQGQITRSFPGEGFYSEEATAKRKAENKVKYLPGWKREQLEEQKKRQAKADAKLKAQLEAVEL